MSLERFSFFPFQWSCDQPKDSDNLIIRAYGWNIGNTSVCCVIEDFTIPIWIELPNNIEQMVEDQICQRQPSDRCWYSDGLGDKIAQAIHTVAAATDRVLGTKLEHKARGCSSCNKRRNALNSLA